MKGKYPLDALVKLRRRAVDERVREVAERVRRAEQAVQAVQAARRARDAEQAQARAVASSEREQLEAGALRAGDLGREAEWARGAAERNERLARREALAADRARAEKHEEQQSRARLANADAEKKAVDEHAARWQRERRAEIDAGEEETAGEAWLSRHLRADRERGGE